MPGYLVYLKMCSFMMPCKAVKKNQSVPRSTPFPENGNYEGVTSSRSAPGGGNECFLSGANRPDGRFREQKQTGLELITERFEWT